MLNTSKESYDNISIPDDKLLAAIGKGIYKKKKQQKKRMFQSFTVATAACILILFGCANIPILYTYAKEIPIIKEFVQALRIGHGGKELGNVTPVVSSDSKSVTLSFLTEGATTDEVLSYSISYHYAPVRVQIVFHGIDSSFYDLLKEKLTVVDAVADIYQIKTLQENDMAVVIVLKELYNYELMEFSNPGSLTINFYQDAYYTEEEKSPGQMIYFLRTDAILSDEEMISLLLKYQEEKPLQIRNMAGEYLLVIGEYGTKEEAEREYREIIKKYGVDNAFYVSEGTIEDVPKR